jgi:parallel beta-helix repeat protein
MKRIFLAFLLVLLSVTLACAGANFTYPQFQAFDNNGVPLSGGLLYTYISGTTTDKATYTTSGMTVAHANPVVLDSRGEAKIYGNGRYKFVLKNSAGTTIWTMDPVFASGGDAANYYYVDPLAADQGAGTGSTIKGLSTLITTAKYGVLVFGHDPASGATTEYKLDTSLDLSTFTNLYFQFQPGAYLDQVTGDETLTVYSLDNIIGPQTCKMFDGSVIASSIACSVFPDRWGAKPDGTTICSGAINYALGSLPTSGGRLMFGSGTYALGDTTFVSDTYTGAERTRTIIFEGIGKAKTNFTCTTGTSAIKFNYTYGNRVYVRNLAIHSSAGTGNGLDLENVLDSEISNVYVGGFAAGIYLHPVYRTMFQGCECRGGDYGFYIASSNSNVFLNNSLHGLETAGVFDDVSTNNVYIGNAFENNSGRGMLLRDVKSTHISGNRFERNTGDYDLYVYGLSNFGSKAVMIENNLFTADVTACPSEGAIVLNHSEYCTARYNNIGDSTYPVGIVIGTDVVARYNEVYRNCPNEATQDLNFSGNTTVVFDPHQVETVTAAAPTLRTWGGTQLDSDSNAITATLPDGSYINQIKTIVMTNADNASTVSVTHHETSDPEIAQFDAVDEYWTLVWTGTEWATVSNSCTFP